MNRFCVLAVLAVMVLAGCTATEPGGAPSVTPEPAEMIEPTSTPTPSLEPIAVRVTFNGERCVYEGPRVFLDGTEVLFEFVPTDDWADHSALVVGDVAPGMTLDEVREDIEGRAAHLQPAYVTGYDASYGPGTLRATMSSDIRGLRATAGYLVACLTDPETTDDAFFGDLLTIAGG